MSKYIHVPSSVLDMPVETCRYKQDRPWQGHVSGLGRHG